MSHYSSFGQLSLHSLYCPHRDYRWWTRAGVKVQDLAKLNCVTWKLCATFSLKSIEKNCRNRALLYFLQLFLQLLHWVNQWYFRNGVPYGKWLKLIFTGTVYKMLKERQPLSHETLWRGASAFLFSFPN